MGLIKNFAGRILGISPLELSALQRNAGSLEARVAELTGRVDELGEKNAGYEEKLRTAERDYNAENAKYVAAEEERERLTLYKEKVIQATQEIFGSLGLSATTLSDKPHAPFTALRNKLEPVLPYIQGIIDNIGAVRKSISVEEQRRNYKPYSDFAIGNPKGYVDALIANTDFGNPNSMLCSTQLMMQDLSEIFRYSSGRPVWNILKLIASNKGTAKLLETAGPHSVDELVNYQISLGCISNDFFEFVFSEHLNNYLSMALRTEVANLRMSSLEISEYEQVPQIIMKIRGHINQQGLQQIVREKLIRSLYRGETGLFSSLSQHPVVKEVLGERYTPEAMLSEAVNILPLNVKVEKSRIAAYENLRQASGLLKLSINPAEQQALARGYFTDVVSINDVVRFEDAKNDQFIKEGLGEDGILNVISSYISKQDVPKSSEEAEFSVKLLLDYEQQLQAKLGSFSYALAFERCANPLGLEQLLGIKSKSIYDTNAHVRNWINTRLGEKVSAYFPERDGASMPLPNEEQLANVVAVTKDLPDNAVRGLLSGVLDFVKERETRTRYVEQIKHYVSQDDLCRIYDGSIRKSFNWTIGGFRDIFLNTLALLEERLIYAGHAGTARESELSSLLEELFISKELKSKPEKGVWLLSQVINRPSLAEYITGNVKAHVFGLYIDDTIAKFRDEPKKQQDTLEALIGENGHFFPKEIVQKMFDYYLRSGAYRSKSGFAHAQIVPPQVQGLISSATIPHSELGIALSNSILNLIFDAQRQRVIPLDTLVDDTYIDLILQHKALIPSQALPQLINYSLQSAGASQENQPYRSMSYNVLKKYDNNGLGIHVQQPIRAEIYQGFVEAGLSRLRVLYEELNSKTIKREEYDGRKIKVLNELHTFANDEIKYLYPEHIAPIFGVFLSHHNFNYARDIFQMSDEKTRGVLIHSITERIDKQREKYAKTSLMRTYIENIGDLLPEDITKQWNQHLSEGNRV